MSLRIRNAVRINPAPCQHYRLTIEEDGVSRTVEISFDELRQAFEDFAYGPKAALVLAWARYRLSQGATLASLLDQEIA
jgi:hypothetical protein